MSAASSAKRLPAVFLSHGSPMLVFEDIPARQFIAGLGKELPRPKAILSVSAHWETEGCDEITEPSSRDQGFQYSKSFCRNGRVPDQSATRFATGTGR